MRNPLPRWIAACLLLASLRVFADVAPVAAGSRAAAGISYRRDVIASEPWNVHIISFARTNQAIRIHTTFGQSERIALANLSQHVTNLPGIHGRPVAAVNGDYFVREGPFAGDPEGLLISEGELISAPNGKSAFWLDEDDQPHLTNVTSRLTVVWPDGKRAPIGLNEERRAGKAVLYTSATASLPSGKGRDIILERGTNELWLPIQPGVTYGARIRKIVDSGTVTEVEPGTLCLSVENAMLRDLPPLPAGASLQLVMETEPALSGASLAIGGGPALLRDGRPTDYRSTDVRHPRTGIGWNDSHFFLVQVDGRQNQLSVGMTLKEFGNYFAKLGCTHALNLDGGGSSTIWCHGQVINSPCEGGERGTGDAIVLTVRAPKD